jgi:hypothetical protein
VEKDREGEVKRLKVGFHMTEPTKMTMGERRQVVDRTVELVVGVQKEFPFAEVWYLTMFPRHVVRCPGSGRGWTLTCWRSWRRRQLGSG